tara:strand:+ start:903 stop:1169 length:267 start_codon:yes stop_codon:yes gene_type:complete
MDTRFGKDFSKPMNINGSKQTLGWYNLVVSIAELRMFNSSGMKPNRHYTLKAVKAYFGVQEMKYSKHELLECLENFKEQLEIYNKPKK